MTITKMRTPNTPNEEERIKKMTNNKDVVSKSMMEIRSYKLLSLHDLNQLHSKKTHYCTKVHGTNTQLK